MSLARPAHATTALLWILVVSLSVLSLLTGCRKKKPPPAPIAFDAAPPPESAVDIEAKDTMRVIVDVYPSICQADAATRAWTMCRDATTGYAAVHACADKGQRETKRALDALGPSSGQHGACADQIRSSAVLFLNTAPKFFADVLAWMQDRHDKLAPQLVGKSLADACREAPALCQGEPHDWEDAYKAMRMRTIEKLDCTSRLYTCGQSDGADCSLASVAPRLGVACQVAENRHGTSPDDLLFVRGTGTPIAR